MNDETSKRPSDVPFQHAGIGHTSMFGCLGCGKRKPCEGRRGVGVRMRCAACVAKRRAA